MRVLKICALATCLVFSAQTAAFSALPLAYRLRVDEKKGTVKERWMGAQTPETLRGQGGFGTGRDLRPTVIVIEDAHISLEAQRNIAGILTEIKPQLTEHTTDRTASNPAVVIGIEGAAGQIETASLQTFPFQKTKTKVLDAYRRLGRLSGAEHWALSGDTSITLVGLEDRALYVKNHSLYASVEDARARAIRGIDTVRTALIHAKEKTFSARLRQFDSLRSGFHADRISFDEYFAGLLSHLEGLSIGIDDCIYACRARELVANAARAPEPADHLKEFRALDMGALLSECRRIEARIARGLARTERERALVSIDESLTTIEPLVRLEASLQDVRLARASREDIRAGLRMIGHIFPQVSPSALAELTQVLLPDVYAFYATAEARNEAFIDTICREAKDARLQHAVLVSGGYHSEGLATLLREREMPYVIISPRVTDPRPSLDYHALMAQTKSAYDELIETSFNALQAVRSLAPLVLSGSVFDEGGVLFRRQIGAEFFAEEAASRIWDEGFVHLSQIEFREELAGAGWKMAGLFEIKRIYAIGEKIGIVETRINERGSIYKVFKDPEAQVALFSEHKDELLQAVISFFDAQIAGGTYLQKNDLLLREALDLTMKTGNYNDRALLVRTVLKVLPRFYPLELAVDEEIKAKISSIVVPRFQTSEQEVVELLRDFKNENPSLFVFSKTNSKSLALAVHGFVESKVFPWLARHIARESDAAGEDGLVPQTTYREYVDTVIDGYRAWASEQFPFGVEDIPVEKITIAEHILNVYLKGYSARIDRDDLDIERIVFEQAVQYSIPHRMKVSDRKSFYVYPQSRAERDAYGIVHPVKVVGSHRNRSDYTFHLVKDLKRSRNIWGMLDSDGIIKFDNDLYMYPVARSNLSLHELGHMSLNHLKKYNPDYWEHIIDVLWHQASQSERAKLMYALIILMFPDPVKNYHTGEPLRKPIETYERIIGQSDYFGIFNAEGDVIGYNQKKLVEELLAWWYQISQVIVFMHPDLIHVAAGTEEALKREEAYDDAARILFTTVSEVTARYTKKTGDSLLQQAGLLDPPEDVMTKDPAGLEHKLFFTESLSGDEDEHVAKTEEQKMPVKYIAVNGRVLLHRLNSFFFDADLTDEVLARIEKTPLVKTAVNDFLRAQISGIKESWQGSSTVDAQVVVFLEGEHMSVDHRDVLRGYVEAYDGQAADGALRHWIVGRDMEEVYQAMNASGIQAEDILGVVNTRTMRGRTRDDRVYRFFIDDPDLPEGAAHARLLRKDQYVELDPDQTAIVRQIQTYRDGAVFTRGPNLFGAATSFLVPQPGDSWPALPPRGVFLPQAAAEAARTYMQAITRYNEAIRSAA